MKVLIISCLPLPLDAGGKVTIYATLEKMQAMPIDITYCAVLEKESELEIFNNLKKKLPQINFVYTNSSIVLSPKKYKRKLLYQFKKNIDRVLKWKVATTAKKYDEFYLPQKINPFTYRSEKFIKEIYEICRAKKYDVIQTEFHQNLDLVSLFPTTSKKVHFIHESRMLRLKTFAEISEASKEYMEFLLMRNQNVETSFLKQYDKTILVSELDKEAIDNLGINNGINQNLPVMDKYLLPNKKYRRPKKLVFLGPDSHTPNFEGVKWFLENCHQSVIKNLNVPLYVIGNWNSAKELTFQYSNVHFLGFCENLDKELEEAIMIVPVWFGSGIRTKILESLAKKTPVIATTKALVGIPAIHKQHLLVANSKQEFENEVRWLLKNDKSGEDMVENGYSFITQNYDQTKYAENRLKLYESLINSKNDL